jgi:hypothetical protein
MELRCACPYFQRQKKRFAAQRARLVSMVGRVWCDATHAKSPQSADPRGKSWPIGGHRPLDGKGRNVVCRIMPMENQEDSSALRRIVLPRADEPRLGTGGLDALMRRAADCPETKLHVGPLELDLIERTAKRGDRSIDLLPREFHLLKYMMRHKDRVLTREMLLREVWRYKRVPKTNLVDAHMGRLRRKINGPHESPMILNVRSKGFLLRVEDGH